MLNRLSFLVFAVVLFSAFATVFAQNVSVQNESTQRLYALFDSEWELGLKENPTFASFLGDKRYNNRWTDSSLAAIEKRNRHGIETLAALKKISRNELSVSDRLNYDLFQKDLEEAIEAAKFKRYLTPITQQGGIQTIDEITQLMNFETVKDYEDWIARMNAFPVLMEQTLTLMREGVKQKILLPKAIMERVPPQIDKMTATGERHPFFAPFKSFPKDIPKNAQESLKTAAKAAIEKNVVPLYAKLKDYFVREYLSASYPMVGVWQRTDGADYYAFLARSNTTTNMTPQQIHDKGLSEVARIRAEMERIKAQVGFKGTLQEFFQFLRTDKRFFYNSPEELLNAYRALTRRVDIMSFFWHFLNNAVITLPDSGLDFSRRHSKGKIQILYQRIFDREKRRNDIRLVASFGVFRRFFRAIGKIRAGFNQTVCEIAVEVGIKRLHIHACSVPDNQRLTVFVNDFGNIIFIDICEPLE
jgi:uncharacterized protein (DUF885 family)